MAAMAQHMDITTTMTETVEEAARQALILQAWLSPAFPIGSFAYSHGLEWAIEAGYVHDAVTCEAWLADLLCHGSWRNDAILLGQAMACVAAQDKAGLADLAMLAAALSPSRERHLETMQQGKSFIAAIRAAWPLPQLVSVLADLPAEIAYPVALGLCGAVHRIDRSRLLHAYGLGFVQALVSAAIRLSVLGQTDGQRVTAGLVPVIAQQASQLAMASYDDLGTATLLSDICSLKHETQYTRLFRS
jgi:urease accessory protein